MMGYKVWSELTNRDEDNVDAYLQDWRILSDELGRDLVLGRPVAHKWPRVLYEVKSDYPPVDAFSSSAELIVSKRLAQLIAEYVPSADVEFLPVTINFKGQPYGQYFILHPLTKIDAIDRQRSMFTLRKDKIRDVDRLTLDEHKLQGRPLVELDSSQWIICVSDELATAIEQSGMRGVVFPTPEKWRPY